MLFRPNARSRPCHGLTGTKPRTGPKPWRTQPPSTPRGTPRQAGSEQKGVHDPSRRTGAIGARPDRTRRLPSTEPSGKKSSGNFGSRVLDPSRTQPCAAFGTQSLWCAAHPLSTAPRAFGVPEARRARTPTLRELVEVMRAVRVDHSTRCAALRLGTGASSSTGLATVGAPLRPRQVPVCCATIEPARL